MATPVEFVDKQWKEWQEVNQLPETTITEDVVREKLIKDLTYASQMDVREYTLYQKWLEVQERYPTIRAETLWGDMEVSLEDPSQEKMLRDVKSMFWMPKDPMEYENLQPNLILANGKMAEKWNAIRTFSSTMKNNSNIGRNLFYIVEDKKTHKYLGVICISSDFLDLTPRDQAIGWAREVKTQQGMINHTAIGSTIVPLQPLGYNYMGGKLLALLCLSDTVQKDWKERYGDTLVGVTTTSLYGATKTGGMSQYDGLEHWNKMGFSAGSVAFEPRRETANLAYSWLKQNYPRKYFEWWEAKNMNGLPLKRDHKNRSLNFVYSKLKIPKNLIRTEHQRGIYFCPLYDNTFPYLRKEISDKDLVKSFDTSTETLGNIWKEKYAKGRIKQLTKQGKVSTESLFYNDLIFLTWEETKIKYLPQVGR